MLNKIITSQKLEQILLNFIDVLRINILIVDKQGNIVLAPKSSGFGYHAAMRWGVLQYLGKSEFLSSFDAEEYYLKSIDKFGFHYFAIPIPIGELGNIGYLIVGPVILHRQQEQSRYQLIAKELGLDYNEFLGSLSEIRVVSFNSLKSILDLLFELSRYALRTKLSEKIVPLEKTDQKQLAHSIFSTLLDLSMALTQAECGSIMLLDKSTNELSVQIFKGIDLNSLRNIPIKLGEGIAGLAAQKKESFVITDGGESNNRIRHLLKKPELKCAVVLPIMKGNKEVLGVMNISTHQETSRLATHSQEMLNSLQEITSGKKNRDTLTFFMRVFPI
jgi:putative methionine-R-sulfoxide reductase with GAF domain